MAHYLKIMMISSADHHGLLQQKVRNLVSGNLTFKISQGNMPLHPARGSHLRSSFCPSPRWIALSRKKKKNAYEAAPDIEHDTRERYTSVV